MKEHNNSLGRDAISEALRQAGMQVTAQRLAVYRAVKNCPHSSADEILVLVREEIGTVSRQAVYDALNAMANKDILRRIQPAGSATRYEHRIDNHHHIVCRNCDAVVDVDCNEGALTALTVDDNHGYQIDEAEVIYWGLCPKCQ